MSGRDRRWTGRDRRCGVLPGGLCREWALDAAEIYFRQDLLKHVVRVLEAWGCAKFRKEVQVVQALELADCDVLYFASCLRSQPGRACVEWPHHVEPVVQVGCHVFEAGVP